MLIVGDVSADRRVGSTAVIAGRVLDSSLQPVAAACVEVVVPEGHVDPPAKTIIATETDHFGTFEIEVPHMRWGGPEAVVQILVRGCSEGMTLTQESILISMSKPEAYTELVASRRELVLSGRVVFADGGPVPCARVHVGAQMGVTDEAGRFEFQVAGWGDRVRLRALLCGADIGEGRQTVSTKRAWQRGLDRAEVSDIVLTIHRPTSSYSIECVAADGLPLSGVQLAGERTPRLESDPSGMLRLMSSPGTTLMFTRDGYRAAYHRLTEELNPTVILEKQLLIAARAIDSEGEPLVGASVSTFTVPGSSDLPDSKAITDEEGSFSFAVGEKDRDRLILVEGRHKNSVWIGETAYLPSAGRDDLVIAAEMAAYISGRVLSASGEPAVGASLWAERVDRTSAWVPSATIRAGGDFSLPVFAAGTYQLTAWLEEAGVTRVHAHAGQDVRIALRPRSFVGGRVRGGDQMDGGFWVAVHHGVAGIPVQKATEAIHFIGTEEFSISMVEVDPGDPCTVEVGALGYRDMRRSVLAESGPEDCDEVFELERL